MKGNRCSVFSIRCSVFGIRYSVFGFQSVDQMPDRNLTYRNLLSLHLMYEAYVARGIGIFRWVFFGGYFSVGIFRWVSFSRSNQFEVPHFRYGRKSATAIGAIERESGALLFTIQIWILLNRLWLLCQANKQRARTHLDAVDCHFDGEFASLF